MKSIQVYFTSKKYEYTPVVDKKQIISNANKGKYIGMALDAKLRWKIHVKKKKN